MKLRAYLSARAFPLPVVGMFLKSGCAGLVMLAVFSGICASAATITVANTNDSGPGSLRAAIASASPADTINFSLVYPAGITLATTLTISSNLTISGPGASSLYISGGNAVQVFNIVGGITVTISGLNITSGLSAGNGGGIYNAGTLTLSNSTVGNNSSFTANGGGIYNAGGTLTVTNSTIYANQANNGAGIYNAGAAALTNTTLFENNARSFFGGAIFNATGTLTLSNSTLSSNDGGAVYNASTLTAKNSILANSSDGANCYVSGGTFTSQGYNLSDDSSCSSYFIQTGDLNSTPAGLDLTNLQNGGPTLTIVLQGNSPAVDAIPLSPTNYCTDVNGAPVTTDQRGVTRPQGGACDIGAFELALDKGLALLSGNNTFTGNQTVNGTVSATSFVGDGSGLTGITTSFATSAGTAATATNALALGGTPASGFVLKAGDAMTGTLNLPANGLVAGNNQLVLNGGNVGIGTATPEAVSGYTSLHLDDAGTGSGGTFLQLTHSATGNKARIVSDSNGLIVCSGCGGNTTPAPIRIKAGDITTGTDSHVTLQPTGNLGIGTVNPTEKLDVAGNINASGAVKASSEAISGTVTAASFVGNGSGLTGITTSAANTANTANFATSAGDAATVGGNPPSAFAPATGSPNYVAKAGDTMTGTLNLPANGLVAGNNQLVLNGGNVGIGTATPEAVSGYTSLHLDDAGTGSGGTFLQLTHSATGNKARIVSDSNGLIVCSGCGGNTTPAPIRIKAGDITTGTDSHVTLQPTGNLGIGTVNPTQKLDVAGNINASGTVKAGGGIVFADGSTQLSAAAGVLSVTGGSGITGTGGPTPVLSLNTGFTDARYLRLAGGTLSGPLAATSFSGNGGALTNLNPANLSAGTAGVNINGNAATATSAVNAANLGGIAASTYARQDIGNAFSGNQSVAGNLNVSGNSATSGSLTIGGGTGITKHLSMTFNAAFPALKPSTCSALTFTLTGASDGDTLALGVPNALMTGGGTLTYSAWVSASDTITIRACNINPNTPQKTAGTGAIRVDVWKH